MIFHVVLMFFCQTVMFTTAQYLMLLSEEKTFECSLLGQVRSSEKMWISIINRFSLHSTAFPQQNGNDMQPTLPGLQKSIVRYQKDCLGHKGNQWGPISHRPLYIKQMYSVSPAKFNMHFLSYLFFLMWSELFAQPGDLMKARNTGSI